ncbi:hypothetical protein ACFX1T_040293 [Malus domestica]
MPSVVESLKSKPKERPQAQLALPVPKAMPTKKMTRSQTSQAFKHFSTFPTEAGRKKQKSARPLIRKRTDPTPQETQTGEEK